MHDPPAALDPRLVQVLTLQLDAAQAHRKRLVALHAAAAAHRRLRLHARFLAHAHRAALRAARRARAADLAAARQRHASVIAAERRAVAAAAVRVPDDDRARALEHARALAWAAIVREDVPRAARLYAQRAATMRSTARKVSTACARDVRRTAYRVRVQRELPLRAHRAMRDMLVFWKRNEKDERETRRKAERAELERLRAEEEAREARRQARKLEFLITQTELYSHFVGKKIDKQAPEAAGAAPVASAPATAAALAQLDFATEDDETLRRRAQEQAQAALNLQLARTHTFDQDARRQRAKGGLDKPAKPADDATAAAADIDQLNLQEPTLMTGAPTIAQPRMLMCDLKSYQLKGLNWLANLYEQGINGILADEMGLGKTVQTIALMTHLAETQGIWGPFLVVAPASTLHNWQQEIARFAPAFKIIPYWGSMKDRQVLRQNWNKLYTKDAPFHVLITSYQLAISDEKYMMRVKWQYMVLDEAQAIKSSSSTRWKTLLGFHARNRLLLTGTPIQNSMKELWALLHFIMPTLFDSHEEFSEWFSRDIEGHVENKSTLNEHQLRRLHMILKPFMLRRIKRHVQHELGEKIEIEVTCELSARQRALYSAIKRRMPMHELLKKGDAANSVDSLMNLVVQFRKVCNHPDLFERADVRSPFTFARASLTSSIARESHRVTVASVAKSFVRVGVPRLVFEQGLACYAETLAGTTHARDHPLAPLSVLRNHPLTGWRAMLPVSLDTALALAQGEHAAETLEAWEHAAAATHRHRAQPALTDWSVVVAAQDDERWRVSAGLLTRLAHLWCHGDTFRALASQRVVYVPKAESPSPDLECASHRHETLCRMLHVGSEWSQRSRAALSPWSPAQDLIPRHTWHTATQLPTIVVPPLSTLVQDSGKLGRLDALLAELKATGHRVLIYFQMTRMIDLIEEYLTYRKYTYLRLDGNSKISDRRDMVQDWQSRSDIFVFLLSTRAGGLGINLTAADTVIFYDSDWNPTVDQQAMDRAHRVGQTKQVTVYRLLTRGTIEERIRNRAKQKDQIQKVVIAGQLESAEPSLVAAPPPKPVDFSKASEIASLLLDEEEG